MDRYYWAEASPAQVGCEGEKHDEDMDYAVLVVHIGLPLSSDYFFPHPERNSHLEIFPNAWEEVVS